MMMRKRNVGIGVRVGGRSGSDGNVVFERSLRMVARPAGLQATIGACVHERCSRVAYRVEPDG